MYNKPAHYYGIDQNCMVLLSYSSSTNGAVRVTMTKVAMTITCPNNFGWASSFRLQVHHYKAGNNRFASL